MKFIAIFIIALHLFTVASAKDFTLQIVPSKVSDNGNYIDGTSMLGPFFVVLTNTSPSNKVIWRDWCSSGYYSLTFTIAGSGEKSFEIQPPGRGWTMNFSDSYLIRPGEHYIWSVDLFKKNYWQGFPPSWNTSGGFGQQQRQVSIQAHFAISENYSDQKIWIGKVSSALMSVTLKCPNIVTEQDAAANP